MIALLLVLAAQAEPGQKAPDFALESTRLHAIEGKRAVCTIGARQPAGLSLSKPRGRS